MGQAEILSAMERFRERVEYCGPAGGLRSDNFDERKSVPDGI
jgi:hypothetical protein